MCCPGRGFTHGRAKRCGICTRSANSESANPPLPRQCMAAIAAACGNSLPLEASSTDFHAIARSQRPNLKEARMSSIANLSSAPSALPPVNVHPHGHRHGSHVESTDDSSSDTAAQVPPGAAQNLFGSLLQSLEQVIGVQSTTATSTAAAAPATATPAGAATTVASASTSVTPSAAGAAAPSVSSSSTLLQNYLNNLSQTLQANGSQSANPAVPNLRVNV